jgi:protein TonB
MVALLILAVSLTSPAFSNPLQDPGRSIYHVGGKVAPPKLTHRVEPKYPDAAREEGREGSVLVSAVVETNGTLSTIKVVKGMGAGFDENAVEALKEWKFQPSTKDGGPVAVYVEIEVTFRLR